MSSLDVYGPNLCQTSLSIWISKALFKNGNECSNTYVYDVELPLINHGILSNPIPTSITLTGNY